MKTGRIGVIVATAILIIFGFVSVFPLLWMVSTSLKAGASIYAFPPQFIPKHPSFVSYGNLFTEVSFPRWLLNSSLVTATTIVLTLAASSAGAYAFAKTSFPGRTVLFVVIIATLMIPYFILVIPLFVTMARLSLINTYFSLIFPQVASPVSIFILRQYMQTIPDELSASARIDGAGELLIFARIVLPLSTPALAAAAVFTFLSSWNAFLWPLVAITSSNMRTLPVGLAALQGEFSSQWSLLTAGSFVSLLPAFILYIALQRYFVQGIAMTGLKA